MFGSYAGFIKLISISSKFKGPILLDLLFFFLLILITTAIMITIKIKLTLNPTTYLQHLQILQEC